jgi:hypothetical protein
MLAEHFAWPLARVAVAAHGFNAIAAQQVGKLGNYGLRHGSQKPKYFTPAIGERSNMPREMQASTVEDKIEVRCEAVRGAPE